MRFSKKNFWRSFVFFGLAGFSVIALPCLFVIAVGFVICGVASPILGFVKMIDYIFTLNIPYVENIHIALGGVVTFHPIIEFVISLVFGLLLFGVGRKAWRMLIRYWKKLSDLRRDWIL